MFFSTTRGSDSSQSKMRSFVVQDTESEERERERLLDQIRKKRINFRDFLLFLEGPLPFWLKNSVRVRVSKKFSIVVIYDLSLTSISHTKPLGPRPRGTREKGSKGCVCLWLYFQSSSKQKVFNSCHIWSVPHQYLTHKANQAQVERDPREKGPKFFCLSRQSRQFRSMYRLERGFVVVLFFQFNLNYSCTLLLRIYL